MAWPTIFANLPGGNQPLALLDGMFGQVAQMVAIPCTATGTNAITLQPIGNAPTLPSYAEFCAFRFKAAASSSSAVTAQFQALAALPVYQADGVTQVAGGNIINGREYTLVYDAALNSGGGGFYLEVAAFSAAAANVVRSYLAGLGMSTPGSSANFTVQPGQATDDTAVASMSLASAYTKNTGAWSLGSGGGALDSGSIANFTWYHVFLIQRVDTGATDLLLSLSPTSPTLPSPYTLKRRIGSLHTNGSAQWSSFTQTGNTFIWANTVADVNGIATTASRVPTVLTVPSGVVVEALFRAGINVTSVTGILFTSLQETDQAPNPGGMADLGGAAGAYANGSFSRLTNTSGQIGIRSSGTGAVYSVETYGWIDRRGRDD